MRSLGSTAEIVADRYSISRERQDEYMGTLVNAWLARGGQARGVRAGDAYVDVGTLHGYREAIRVLAERSIVSEIERPIERVLCSSS